MSKIFENVHLDVLVKVEANSNSSQQAVKIAELLRGDLDLDKIDENRLTVD